MTKPMTDEIKNFKKEMVEYVNDLSAAINKELTALNSGALVAFLHFWPNASHDNHCLSPIKCFAFGLTAILITAACNYFGGLLLFSNPLKGQNKILLWGAIIFALLSALSFLIGVWIIALYFVK